MRIAVVTSHPIQYNAPFFRCLSVADGVELKVFYLWNPGGDRVDPEFGKAITWDIPLLDGYESEFVPNVAPRPGSDHFLGIDNPEAGERIRAFGADLIIIFGWSFKTNVRLILNFSGKVPIYFRGDSTLFSGKSGFKGWLRDIFLRFLYSRVDTFLYPGIRNREYLSHHHVQDDKLCWMPHAVEGERFGRDVVGVEAAKALRFNAGIPEDATVFLFSGKLVARKQPLLLAKAFEILAAKYPDVHLVFAGSGELEAELKSSCDGSRCTFLGFINQSEMPVVYAASDVLVLPSNIESWGLSVNEAMWASLPCIVSNRIGCAPDLVGEGGTGRVFECGNRDALLDAMEYYALDPERVRSEGQNARVLMNRWSIGEAVERLLENARGREIR